MRAIRYRVTERYHLGWIDPRGVFQVTPASPEPKEMSVAYCNHYQRDTPHADGVCIYHKSGECQ